MLGDNIADLNFCRIEVLHQKWNGGSAFSYEAKVRPYCGICFVDSGSIKYKSAHGELSAHCGDIVILKKSARYKAVFSDFTQNILINFYCEGFFDNNENDIIVFKNCTNQQKNFFDILTYNKLSGRKCMVKALLYKIMDELCTAKPKNSAYEQIKQLIDSDLTFRFSEKDLATMCAVSVSTLQRTFKRFFGKTISEYRSELKLLQAKNLLIEGNCSNEEIAEALEFCDSAYFSKWFKKSTGLSPKQYLKQYYTM